MRLVARYIRAVMFATLALVAGAAAAQAPAQPADVLAGKTIRWIIASSPNSNTDNFARGLIEQMKAELPSTTILVQNIASSAVALAEADSATGDALVVVTAHVTSIYGQMLGTDLFPFDLSRFHWIGALTNNERIVAVRADLGAETMGELTALDRTLMAPVRSASTPGAIEIEILREMFALDLNVVPDIDEDLTSALFLAGDADIVINSYRTLMPLIESGEVNIVARMGADGFPPELQDVPTLASIAPAGTPGEVVDVVDGLNRLGRLVMAVPSVDQESVDALRRAFDQATASPSLATYYAEHNLILAPTPAAEVERRMDFLLADPASAAALRSYLGRP